jgi:hypothetical protein
MKAKTLILVGLAMLIVHVPQNLPAAIVPAGTILIIRTLHAVASADAVGSRFPVQLANNVAVKGKVIFPAGAKLSAKVVTSRRLASSSDRLTVDLIDVHAAGHVVAIKTTGAQVLSNDHKTRSGVSVSRASYTVAAGKLMQFQLAQPLHL